MNKSMYYLTSELSPRKKILTRYQSRTTQYLNLSNQVPNGATKRVLLNLQIQTIDVAKGKENVLGFKILPVHPRQMLP